MGKSNRPRWRPVPDDASVFNDAEPASPTGGLTFLQCNEADTGSTQGLEDKIKDQELQLEECRSEMERLRSVQAGEFQAQLADKEMVVVESQREIQKLQCLLSEAAKQCSSLEKQVEDRDMKLGLFRKEIEMLQSMREEVKSSFSAMQTLIKEKDNKLLECNRTIDDLQSLSDDWSGERMALERELEESTNEIQSLQSLHAILCGFGMTLEAQAGCRELNLYECRAEVESLKLSHVQDAIELKEASAVKHQLQEQVQHAENELKEYKSELHKTLYDEISAMKLSHLSAKASWQGHLLRDARNAAFETLCTCFSAWRQEGIIRNTQLTLGAMAVNACEASLMGTVLKMCWLAWRHALHLQGQDCEAKVSAPAGMSDGPKARSLSPRPILLSSGNVPLQNVVFPFVNSSESKTATASPSPGPSRNCTFPFTSKSEGVIRQSSCITGATSPRAQLGPQRVCPSNVKAPTRCASGVHPSFMGIPQTPKGGSDAYVIHRCVTPVQSVAWKR